MRYPALIAAALLGAGAVWQAPARAVAQVTPEQPSQVIEAAAQQTLHALDADRAAYRNDPAKIQGVVDQYLLPHFDSQLAAQLVLGRYWRKATPAQRQEFISAFIHSMLDTYGSALLDLTANTLKVYPSHVPPDKTDATVRTDVTRANGARDSVIFYMKKTSEGWKVWDVHFDGISYVVSYHEDLQAQLAQQSIDAVIKRLEGGEKPARINRVAGKRP